MYHAGGKPNGTKFSTVLSGEYVGLHSTTMSILKVLIIHIRLFSAEWICVKELTKRIAECPFGFFTMCCYIEKKIWDVIERERDMQSRERLFPPNTACTRNTHTHTHQWTWISMYLLDAFYHKQQQQHHVHSHSSHVHSLKHKWIPTSTISLSTANMEKGDLNTLL